jgi:hypothetical protein
MIIPTSSTVESGNKMFHFIYWLDDAS